MDNNNAWEQFSKTGSIYAYLEYKGLCCNNDSDLSGGEQNVGVFHRRTDNQNHRYREQ